jgi:hypothetical protein
VQWTTSFVRSSLAPIKLLLDQCIFVLSQINDFHQTMTIRITIGCAIILFILNGCFSKNEKLNFDPSLWRQGDGDIRFRMKEDLFANHKHRILGHRKEDVITLLGPPDIDSPYSSYPIANTTILIYGMGDGSDEAWDPCPCNLDLLVDSAGYVFDMSGRDN